MKGGDTAMDKEAIRKALELLELLLILIQMFI
jgi:hypothetical protein